MGNAQSSPDVEIPEKMKRLVLAQPSANPEDVKFEVEELDVPSPKAGQVLIKVAASPINPSDFGVWMRSNPEGFQKRAIGNEGSGVVVATGGGYSTSGLLGKKVGFVNLPTGQGAYSEYVIVDAMKGAFVMPDELPVEAAASFFVNPYTAYGILDTAKNNGAKAFIHTAAASQLGQMLVKLVKQENTGIELINVVRRVEQADVLKALGATHVVVTSEENWRDELKALGKKLGASIAFDAVAGEMTGDLMDILPKGGKVYVYGVLAGNMQKIDPINLIYYKKKLEGFMLNTWLMGGGMIRMLPRLRSTTAAVAAGLENGWSKTEFQETSMENMHKDFIQLRKDGFTNKKLCIRF